MKLLHIDSSVLAEHSVSRQLTARIVTEWQATHPGTAVEYLDLAQDTPATLSGAELAARVGALHRGQAQLLRGPHDLAHVDGRQATPKPQHGDSALALADG